MRMTAPPSLDDRWRQTHLGRLLGHAMRRFDARVLQLMARDVQVPLALSNLAARGKGLGEAGGESKMDVIARHRAQSSSANDDARGAGGQRSVRRRARTGGAAGGE